MKKYKIIILLTILALPINVRALTGNIYMECNNSKVVPGSELKCKIMGKTDEKVTSLSANTVLSKGVTIKSFTAAEGNFQGEISKNGTFELYNGNKKDTFEIGTLVLNIDANIKSKKVELGLADVTFNDSKFKPNKIESYSINLDVVEKEQENTGLKSLVIAGIPIDLSTFGDSNITIDKDYLKIVGETYNNEGITIFRDTGEKHIFHSNDQIDFIGNNSGEMLLQIFLGNAIEGKKPLYNIIVVRDKKDDETIEYDNSLKSLYVGGKKVNLGSNKNDEYTVSLDSIKEGYTVKAEVSDPERFKIDELNGGEGTYTASNFILKVIPKETSKGYKSRTYKITIKLPEEKEDDNKTDIPNSNPGGNSNGEPTGGNPPTGNISIFIITILIVSSLVASLLVYKKNLEYYN